MKKITTVLLFSIFALTIQAQTTKAYFDSNSKQKLNETTIAYTFQLDNIATAQQKQVFEDAFKAVGGVIAVKGAFIPATKRATYTVSLPKAGHNELLQRMLSHSGVKKINIDGKDIDTNSLMTFIKEQKGKK